MARTTIKLTDQEWSFSEDDLTLEDAFLIKSGTGLALRPFLSGVADLDPTCLQGLIWFLRHKAGDRVAVESVQFRIAELDISQDADPPE